MKQGKKDGGSNHTMDCNLTPSHIITDHLSDNHLEDDNHLVEFMSDSGTMNLSLDNASGGLCYISPTLKAGQRDILPSWYKVPNWQAIQITGIAAAQEGGKLNCVGYLLLYLTD